MIHPAGGTHILRERLEERLPRHLLKGVNLIVSSAFDSELDPKKINVLWNHHDVDQPVIQNLKNPEFVDKLALIVFVSHWQYQRYLKQFELPEYKCIVIRNAAEKFHNLPQKPSGTLNLLYASTPWRGLTTLLQSFTLLNRDDIRLYIYSSTKLYGQQFYEENERHFSQLYEYAASLPGVQYCGFAPNSQIRKTMESTHVLAYPSTWKETSCLTAIESGLAGVQILTTNLGALPETCGSFATFIPFHDDKKLLVNQYAKALDQLCDQYWSEENHAMLKKQKMYFEDHWSWDQRIHEWISLFESIQDIK